MTAEELSHIYRVLNFTADFHKLSGRRVWLTGQERTLPYNGGELVGIEDVNTGERFYIRRSLLKEE